MIQYNKCLDIGIRHRILPEISYVVSGHDPNNSINVLLIDGITTNNFISDKMIDALGLSIQNPDNIGNILPGYWDDRYSFDVQKFNDPHWYYAITFLKSCVKMMQEILEKSDLKEVSFALPITQDCNISLWRYKDGYCCNIKMPMHFVIPDKEFFNKMMDKKNIKNDVLGEDDED